MTIVIKSWSLGETEMEALLRRCRERDPDAWATLIEKFKGLVYSIPRQQDLGEDDAADVFQHTFQALLNNLDRIETPQHLGRWLAVTAARECLRIRRMRERVPIGTEADALDKVLDAEERGAETHALKALQTQEIQHAMRMMPERCRRLLDLLFFEEHLGYQEISDRVNIPIGAIGPTRARCLEKLRKILAERGFFA